MAQGRWSAALDDAKRAISLKPGWGKAYSRAGLAALSAGDEEAAYWCVCIYIYICVCVCVRVKGWGRVKGLTV